MIIFRPYMIDLCFKTVEGQRAFFPNGKLSRGRIVNSDQEAALRKFLSRWFGVTEVVIIATIVLQSFVGIERGIVFDAAALALLVAGYYLIMARLLKDCPVSDIRITAHEIRLKQAHAMSIGRLYRLLVTSIVLTALSALGLRISLKAPGWNTVLSGVGILLFGAGTILFIYLLRLRRRPEAQP